MSAKSQNGWATLTPDSNQLRIITIGPKDFTGHTGPAGFVLGHWALWSHEEIEPIDVNATAADDHWYGQRLIGGTTIPSNHWSATAIDLNAALHPQGVKAEDTFTPAQCRRIRARFTRRYPVLRWGGDFGTRPGSTAKPDAMHTELRPLAEASKADVRTLALELVHTPLGKRLQAMQDKPFKWENW